MEEIHARVRQMTTEIETQLANTGFNLNDMGDVSEFLLDAYSTMLPEEYAELTPELLFPMFLLAERDRIERDLNSLIAGNEPTNRRLSIFHWESNKEVGRAKQAGPRLCVGTNSAPLRRAAQKVFAANNQISAHIEKPDHKCDPRAEAAHPHVMIHLNGGPRYGHGGCLTTGLCVGCDDSSQLDALLDNGSGTINLHLEDSQSIEVLLTVLNQNEGHAILARTRETSAT